MVKIIMSGCSGRMGKVISDIVAADVGAEIVAGIDVVDDGSLGYPVYRSAGEIGVDADVIIDFSSPKVIDSLLAYATEKNVPIVLCTTGFSDAQLKKIEAASEKVAILRSANMSLGINTIMEMLKTAVGVFCPAGFDVEIVEQHHHNKLDAPSGTALALADTINEAAGGKFDYVYDRSDRRKKRGKKELGISAVRGGSIPGTHDVIFAGQDEVIEVRHIAYSRSIFGNGAVSAAKFLKGKPAGKYSMAEVIADAVSVR
ncbi:MAG: 4-hydroxy-tetrahydrodipicolinate reductase [Eubacterium sp.]|nr:4-hydroxy-tetrahydrodipicolinate reductase [Eubacterium sp.]